MGWGGASMDWGGASIGWGRGLDGPGRGWMGLMGGAGRVRMWGCLVAGTQAGPGEVQAGQPPRSLRRSGLQMLQDCPKARREVELHWRASQCPHIVRIVDVYENLYAGRKCLLIVMEW